MSERWRARWLCAGALAWWGMNLPAGAQVGSGALAGTVLDEAGAAVPGATVTATAVATNLARTTITATDGGFNLPALSPGTYRVRVELRGFRPLTREGIRLSTGETVRADVQLELGGVSEGVTVRADAPLLRGDSSGLGHVVDNRKVVDLPLNGRSFMTLATLVAGAAMPPRPAAPLPRINGGRPRTNEYLFDGISVRQLEYLGRDGLPRAARPLHKNNFGPRLGIVGRVTDRTVARMGYGLVWIEMAGITTPFTTRPFRSCRRCRSRRWTTSRRRSRWRRARVSCPSG